MEEEAETLQEKLKSNEEEENKIQNMQEENTISNTNVPSYPDLNTYNNPPVYTSAYTNPNNIQNNINVSNQSPSAAPKDTNTMWYDFSLISWFLLLCSGWSLFKSEKGSLISQASQRSFVPLYFDLTLAVGFTSAISTIGFIMYFRNTTLSKNQSYLTAFQGEMTKFHFVPLLLMSIVFFILSDFSTKASAVFGMLFSLAACGSLGFIYFKTGINGEWYEIITTKKGTYSSLLAMGLYSFFFFAVLLGNDPNFINGLGIVFSLLLGAGILGFAFYFKDVVAAVTNLLIFLGMGKYFYNVEYDGHVPGVIDSLMIIFSFGLIFILVSKERERIYKS